MEFTDPPATITEKALPYHSSYTALDGLGLRGHRNLCRSLMTRYLTHPKFC